MYLAFTMHHCIGYHTYQYRYKILTTNNNWQKNITWYTDKNVGLRISIGNINNN